MRIMNVRNFRGAFPTLAEPVTVISREKIIGTWTPGGTHQPIMSAIDSRHVEAIRPGEPPSPQPVEARRMTQTERDAILRKVNRTGRQ